jgi:hypothetical protein
MGKIDEARQLVKAKQAEIARRRQLLAERMAELGRLEGRNRLEFDPDTTGKIAGLRQAIDDLRDSLPTGNEAPGQSGRLRLELEVAERNLDDVRRQRWNLSRKILDLEARERVLAGRGPALVAAFKTALDICESADLWPANHDARQARGLWGWAKETVDALAALPAMRARLADYGDDPGYGAELEAQEARATREANFAETQRQRRADNAG